MPDWLPHNLPALVALSLGITFLTALAGLIAILRLPPNHFSKPLTPRLHGLGGILRRLGQNLIGFAIIGVGLVLSIPLIPGPGLLLILVGLTLTNFPGKRRLETRLLRLPAILKTLNYLRTCFHRPPLNPP